MQSAAATIAQSSGLLIIITTYMLLIDVALPSHTGHK
jgi:hypothetical protein